MSPVTTLTAAVARENRLGDLRQLLLRRRRVFTVATNMAIAAGAYVLAVALRFDLHIPEEHRAMVFEALPALLGAKLVGFWIAGLFAGWWRHVTFRDLETIVRGNVLGSVFFLTAMVFVVGLDGFPRSVFLMDLIICTGAMAGTRVAIRLLRERSSRPPVHRIDTLALVVGAGAAGIQLLEEIENRSGNRVGIVGFVDDDPGKQDVHICGTPVLGTVEDIPKLVTRYGIDEVLIALPSASGQTLRRIVGHCREARVRHRVLPTLGELVEGRVMYTQMRDVKLDDLLAREPITLDTPSVRKLLVGETVLVTGAAGSIGSELCRQAAAYGPRRLVLFDRHENGVFHLENELRARHPELDLVAVLGDVLLTDQVARVFAEHRPGLVLHAAAYKHVPLAETNVVEAVRNNVIGSWNVAQAARAHGAREFVLVSTDKAVRPTSLMGATKRAAEVLLEQMQNGGCRFVVVRFGNVLGSAGSVVPLFRDQIARGGPVTVTDPAVKRYFMTIPEASQLILQAAALGAGGEVFVLEMGQLVSILDIARQIIRFSGYEPDEDIPIVFTGLRPGEKLEEELVDEDESIAGTYHERIKVIRRSTRSCLPPEWHDTMQRAVRAGDVPAILRLLRIAVPGYTPSEGLFAILEGSTDAAPAVAWTEGTRGELT